VELVSFFHYIFLCIVENWRLFSRKSVGYEENPSARELFRTYARFAAPHLSTRGELSQERRVSELFM
jgi:hypothetical protein